MTDKAPEQHDDAEARRLRAERLRAEIEAMRGGRRSPPRSPRDFTDRAADEQAGAGRTAPRDDGTDDGD